MVIRLVGESSTNVHNAAGIKQPQVRLVSASEPMCLIAFNWQPGRAIPLVLAANRDEFHARGAEALHWWPHSAGVLAGRDEQAGGTWLAVRRDGRWAALTNYRDPRAASGTRSRGELPLQWLDYPGSATAFGQKLRAERKEYGPFNLLFGTPDALFIVGTHVDHAAVEPGVHALSNHLLDTPWPKSLRAVRGMQQWQETTDSHVDALLNLLDDREPAAPEDLPDTGVGAKIERFLSAPFIVGEDYGTRCSTALLLAPRITLAERRFDHHGEAIGERAFSWTPASMR